MYRKYVYICTYNWNSLQQNCMCCTQYFLFIFFFFWSGDQPSKLVSSPIDGLWVTWIKLIQRLKLKLTFDSNIFALSSFLLSSPITCNTFYSQLLDLFAVTQCCFLPCFMSGIFFVSGKFLFVFQGPLKCFLCGAVCTLFLLRGWLYSPGFSLILYQIFCYISYFLWRAGILPDSSSFYCDEKSKVLHNEAECLCIVS